MQPLIGNIIAEATMSAARRLATDNAVAVVRPSVPAKDPLVINLALIRIEININL